jgi:hypothetical protein
MLTGYGDLLQEYQTKYEENGLHQDTIAHAPHHLVDQAKTESAKDNGQLFKHLIKAEKGGGIFRMGLN